MKKLTVLAAIVAALVAVSGFGQNTGGTQVAQQQTHYDACTPIGAQAAAGSQTTLTIPAPTNGQYIYVGEIDFDNVVGTALGGVLAPTNVTTTNLGSLKWAVSLPVTANTNYPRGPFMYPTGAKATTPNTAVTIVGVTGTANLTQTINACYWYGF